MKNKVSVSRNNLYQLYLVGFFLILALPLLNLPPWFSPPDWGKTIIFRIVLSALFFFFLSQALSNKSNVLETFVERSKSNRTIWLLVALGGIFLLATFFSLERDFSLWGSPYRSGGFINFAFYLIFALLAFFLLDDSAWRKVWNFAIGVGILVSIIAILQWQGLLEKFLITFETRPPATIGGPIFLAIYLLLLSFLTLSFGLEERKRWKKVFYLLSFLLFGLVILITYTRAAFLGLFIGTAYFLLFYPKRWPLLKILTLFFLAAGIYTVYYLNTTSELPQFIQANQTFKEFTSRFLIQAALADPRASGWQISWQALKARPLLGYGPENFSIGFDRFYDPTLPGINKISGGGGASGWWDRAHNLIFDIALQAGLIALIIYLALFVVLFRQLQQLKKTEPEKNLSPHALQATFLAYLTANFFSFDTFSTYLMSFLLVSYALFLIQSGQTATPQVKTKTHQRSWFKTLRRQRGVLLLASLIVLGWFNWQFNLKPFRINTQINIANYASAYNDCPGALERLDSLLASKSFLDSYLRLKYNDILKLCLDWKKNPLISYQLTQKAVALLKENTRIRPTYTRSWFFLGMYTNYLINKEKTEGAALPERIAQLKQEANLFFEKAHQLSPGRQEILVEWTKADLFTEEFKKAQEKSEQCITLNPELGDCHFMAALAQIYLRKTSQAEQSLASAREKGHPIESSEASLLQLAKAYAAVENYPQVIQTYQQLVSNWPNNPQYHASLATALKEVGDYAAAREEALKVLELEPANQATVEQFLKSLPSRQTQ